MKRQVIHEDPPEPPRPLTDDERQSLMCEEAYQRAVELGYVKSRLDYLMAVKPPTGGFGGPGGFGVRWGR